MEPQREVGAVEQLGPQGMEPAVDLWILEIPLSLVVAVVAQTTELQVAFHAPVEMAILAPVEELLAILVPMGLLAAVVVERKPAIRHKLISPAEMVAPTRHSMQATAVAVAGVAVHTTISLERTRGVAEEEHSMVEVVLAVPVQVRPVLVLAVLVRRALLSSLIRDDGLSAIKETTSIA
jgi:hypothetical protein